MIRSLWYLITLLFATIWFAGIAVGAGLLGIKRKPGTGEGRVYDWCARTWARRLLKSAGTPVTVVGFEQVPQDQPVIYMSNHQSWFDILALLATLPGIVRFMAKKEMRSIPLLGLAMKSAGHIYIDRGNRTQAFGAYDDAAAAIKSGISATVFPEGTRSRTGDLLPFKKGPFVLAIKAQVPVIPVFCAGTFRILPKGSMRLRPHKITLLFGAPISPAGLTFEDRDTLGMKTRSAIEALRVDAGSRDG